MPIAGFIVIAFMLTAYVLLDGFDLGIAAVAPFIAKDERERAATMSAIGPFWNGNEVWLIAAGAALFALFPAAYASSFSGFYLPFILVLWLLMFRGIALEVRGHFSAQLWHQFWDAAFCWSSALLIFLFGIALGNLLRGLPLDRSGYFQGTFAFLLNPYALTVGIFAVVTLGLHGAAFAAMRIEGDPAARAFRLLQRGWLAMAALYAVVTAMTFLVRGTVHAAWPFVLVALSLATLAGVWRNIAARHATAAFLFSCGFIATLLIASAATLFPYLLPAFPPASGGISIFDAPSSPAALICALTVTIGGIVAVAIYSSMVWRRMAGRVPVE